jgi:hypothetical protein
VCCVYRISNVSIEMGERKEMEMGAEEEEEKVLKFKS